MCFVGIFVGAITAWILQGEYYDLSIFNGQNTHNIFQLVIMRIPSVKELNEQVSKAKDEQMNYIYSLLLFKYDIDSLIILEHNVKGLSNSSFKSEIMQRITFRKDVLARKRWQEKHPQAFVVDEERERQKVLMIPVYQSIRARAVMLAKQLKKMQAKRDQSRYLIVLQRCKDGFVDSVRFLKDVLCCKNFTTKTNEEQPIEDESTILKPYLS